MSYTPDGHRILHSVQNFPVLQNRMYSTADEAKRCPLGDIELVEDQKTGLVYNSRFDPGLVVYDGGYQSEQSHSARFQEHLEWAREVVLKSMGERDDVLVEIGCGKGVFLNMLAESGANVIGYDPAYEGDDPRISKSGFGENVSLRAQGLILRHVLEHIVDPVSFLRMLARANGGGGTVYVEVPCFDWICRNRSWFDIYYEHVNYFRLSDFRRMFGRILECGHCFSGQYIYVVADLADIREPEFDRESAVEVPDGALSCFEDDEPGAEDVVWGAASKGLIYSLMRDRIGAPVHAITDINPAKQNRYIAALGLRVFPPEEILPTLGAESRILIMNREYAGEIRALVGDAQAKIKVM